VSLLGYLTLGLATSLHCVAMCGGLVLTYSVGTDAGAGIRERLVPHLVYHSAKIASYVTVALVLGWVVSVAGGARVFADVRDWVLLIAGVYMVLLGLGMTGRFPALRRLSPRPPRFLVRLFSRNRRLAVSGEGGIASPLVFGLLTGLMPCAPLIAAQIGAAASGSPLSGAGLMAAFGLGTAPALIAFGLASGYASKTLRDRLAYVAAAAVVVFGLVIVGRGLMLVGSPVTYDSIRRSVIGGQSESSSWREEAGYPVFDLVIENTEFVPDTVTLPAGRKARIVVARREDDPCSAQLAIPQLGVLADLRPNGTTVVEVPAATAGTYTLTCGMGMMSGRLVVEQ